jgi:hypothetical protein
MSSSFLQSSACCSFTVIYRAAAFPYFTRSAIAAVGAGACRALMRITIFCTVWAAIFAEIGS